MEKELNSRKIEAFDLFPDSDKDSNQNHGLGNQIQKTRRQGRSNPLSSRFDFVD